jgi:hypothetical protein
MVAERPHCGAAKPHWQHQRRAKRVFEFTGYIQDPFHGYTDNPIGHGNHPKISAFSAKFIFKFGIA